MRHSFPQVWKAEEDDAFMSKIEVVAERLIALQDDRTDAALELCLALKTSGVAVYGNILPAAVYGSALTRLHHMILKLLGMVLSSSGPYESSKRQPVPPDADVAAIKRRLCTSMEVHGCQDADFDMKGLGLRDRRAECVCQRRVSLELLHFLQIAAYGQIRAKVYATLGRLVCAELCDMLFEYAMAAEEIPLDPRVCLEEEGVHGKLFLRRRPFQYSFRDEYRCPKFRGFIGDSGRRVGGR